MCCAKRSIIAWCLYDWAISSFATIISTFIFAAYFTQMVAVNKIVGTAQWGNTQAFAGIVIALSSPILGAIADYQGRRKPWLAVFTMITIAAAAALWYAAPSPTAVTWTLSWVAIGSISLEIGVMFYNAMLGSIAPTDYIGRISGWAWGCGYFGGLCALSVALLVFIQGNPAWLGLSSTQAEPVRACGPLVSLWVAAFSWPLFLFTQDRPATHIGFLAALQKGLGSLIKTFHSIRQHRQIFKFLLARMLYIDGLTTVFAFGGIYAAGTFNMSLSEVIQFGIAMNVAAGIGAIAFAWLDDLKGSKLTILLTLSLMVFFSVCILIVHSKPAFWIFGMGLSTCVGPIQAASRSLLTRMAPADIMTELFGLYAFSGKATAFLGPLTLSIVTTLFQSQRAGMSTIIVFLVVGAFLLSRVRA